MRITTSNRTLTAADLKREPLELLNCDKLIIQGPLEIDCQYQHLIGLLVQDCPDVTIFDVTVRNPASIPGPAGHDQPGHSFQRIRGGIVRFVRCTSIYQPRPGDENRRVEDHFNAFGPGRTIWKQCRAIGPTTRAGTAWCIDQGSTTAEILECDGRQLGPTGITHTSGQLTIRGTTIQDATDACLRTWSPDGQPSHVAAVHLLPGNQWKPTPGGRTIYTDPRDAGKVRNA